MTACLFWCACAVALLQSSAKVVVFDANNTLSRFREEPSLWLRYWKLDADAADLQPYSREGEPKHGLIDALYPFAFERDFDPYPWIVAFRSAWWASYVVSGFYLISLRIGISMMENRKPLQLKGLLACWNLLLAVFSFIGALRCGVHLAMMLSHNGFEYTLCRKAAVSYGVGSSGLWTMLFILSKYVELVDTVFLVLRKRTVGFLHWYHHFTVLMYCWHSYIWEMPTGIYFVVMNYCVHSVMYFYYFLAAVCPKPPKWALLVTILQLAQMAAGIYVTVLHVAKLRWWPVRNCDGYQPNLVAALTMYASYFLLFAQFFAKRYCMRRSSKKQQ